MIPAIGKSQVTMGDSEQITTPVARALLALGTSRPDNAISSSETHDRDTTPQVRASAIEAVSTEKLASTRSSKSIRWERRSVTCIHDSLSSELKNEKQRQYQQCQTDINSRPFLEARVQQQTEQRPLGDDIQTQSQHFLVSQYQTVPVVGQPVLLPLMQPVVVVSPQVLQTQIPQVEASQLHQQYTPSGASYVQQPGAHFQLPATSTPPSEDAPGIMNPAPDNADSECNTSFQSDELEIKSSTGVQKEEITTAAAITAETSAATAADAHSRNRLGTPDLSPVHGERKSWTGDGSEIVGGFDDHETNALSSFMDNYCSVHSLDRHGLCERVWSNDRIKDTFWDDVSSVLPNRSRASVYKHVRRAYHVFTQRGKWRPQEDQRLSELVTTKGAQWKLIGHILERMPEDCRDRWRNYVKCGGGRKQYKWSCEEEDRLIQIVQALAQEQKKINWTEVSERMGGTRSRIQCRYKWRKLHTDLPPHHTRPASLA